MIKIPKDCTTCVYEDNKHVCQKYCKLYVYHEFKCDYCKYRLIGKERFCEMENDDGSQNCCGDHFGFNSKEFEII